jgi:hypothetical protein
MSFAYPKLTHMTLPSVESWNTNMNLLRDPPRSITTRRIDKTLQTSDMNEMIDASTDRACESIRVYARGVNPMQSVSYDNNSNNAGVSGNMIQAIPRKSAMLPYRTMIDGAIRMPIIDRRELTAKSKLNRVWTQQVMTKPSFIDYSKSKQCPTKFRVIKDLLTSFDVKPNKSAKLEQPLKENFKMEGSINDKHINIEANAGSNSCGMEMSDYTRENVDMYKGAGGEIIEAWADTNPSQHVSQGLDGMSINEKKYIHDFLNYQANTNHSTNNPQGLDNVSVYTGKFIQDSMQYEKNSGINPGYTFLGEMAQPEQERKFPTYHVESSVSDPRINKKINHENKIELSRNLPQTSVRATVTRSENFDSMNASSRNYKLQQSLKIGGFENLGIQHRFDRENISQGKSGSSDKDKMRDFFNKQQFGRN